VSLVLVGVLPVLGLTVYSAVDQRREAGERMTEEAARLAALAALREADIVDSGREMLTVIAELPPVRAGDGAGCAARLRDLLPAFPQYANIGVVGPGGGLVCSAVPAPDGATMNFADRPWFERAVASGAFSAGDYQLGRITGRPSLVFGLPVTGAGGELRAVTWAALDLGWLQQFAAKLRLPGRPAVGILDRQGVVLARYPDPDLWVGRRIPQRPLKAILGQRESTMETEGIDGIRRLYSITSLDSGRQGPSAYVFVGIPTSVAYADANHALHRNLALLAVITLAGLVGAWFTAGRLVLRPARRLIAGARRLAGGDLGARVGSAGFAGELGEVAGAFDDMASALEQRDDDLQHAVTDRERSQAELQAILDNAPLVIAVKGADGRYLVVNREFERVTGRPRQTVRGRTDVEVFGAEAAAALQEHDDQVLRAGAPVERHFGLSAPDGARTYTALKFPLRDPSGAGYAVCTIATDITERARVEAERQALEGRVQQFERLESLGQLAGGVAHDFNNLLAIILNYTEFVRDALPAEAPAGLQATFDSIRSDLDAVFHAGQSAVTLTRQLLIFARRDASQPDLLDLGEAVEKLTPLLRRTIGEDIALEFDLAPGLDPVRADAGRLEQVVINLAVNARDAMAGGGRLIVRTEGLEVTGADAARAGMVPGRYARLSVRDTGAGMPPDVAARAFEPFFTTKSKGHGTGLGLATVFGIVTEAGGHISIDSRLGRGTAVLIDLPVVAGDVACGSAPASGEHPAGRGETVLVVEDEEPVRKVAERILSSQGYTVLAASGADEALRTCRGHPGTIDLVVTDVVMPGLSGPKLVNRARYLRPGVRSLYVSGYPEDVLARRHPESDDSTVLIKPFTAESLLRTVRRVLDREPAA
jgi:PAS domain S-box-containing protein